MEITSTFFHSRGEAEQLCTRINRQYKLAGSGRARLVQKMPDNEFSWARYAVRLFAYDKQLQRQLETNEEAFKPAPIVPPAPPAPRKVRSNSKSELRKALNVIKREKRAIIARLQALTIPYMWGSGYVDSSEPDGKFRLLVWGRKQNPKYIRESAICYKLKGHDSEWLNIGIQGFHKDGVITDGWGGGLATQPYDAMTLRDLQALEKMANKRIPEYFKDKP